MQVKKFEADTILDALKEVKKALGPDAIVLSTQEVKKNIAGGKKYIVVAAVSEAQLKKKELAEKKLGSTYQNKLQDKSAQQQKQVIESVYQRMNEKNTLKSKSVTQTPYIDIQDTNNEATAPSPVMPVSSSASPSSAQRVKQAVRDAFRTSLDSDFFGGTGLSLGADTKPSVVSKASDIIMSPALTAMLQKLKDCGVGNELLQKWQDKIVKDIPQHLDRKAMIDSWFAQMILHSTQVCAEEIDEKVEIFVGPHGAGKTTSLLKLASYYTVHRPKSVVLLSTDLNKVGAFEQLKVYSRILNIPLVGVHSVSELSEQVQRLSHFDKILIDTQGMSLSSMNELEMIQRLTQWDIRGGHRTHLVLSALAKFPDLIPVLKRFQVSRFHDLIVTSLDQTTQHGMLLNLQSKINSPFHSFGIGSDIVDGFEFASKERVLDLVFRLTKNIGEKSNDSRI